MSIFIPKWEKFKEKPTSYNQVDWDGIAGEYALDSLFIRDIGEVVHLYNTDYVFNGSGFSNIAGGANFSIGATEASIIANITPASLPTGNNVFVSLGGAYNNGLCLWVDNFANYTQVVNTLSVNFSGYNRAETLQNSIVAGKSTDVSASYDGANNRVLVTHDDYMRTSLVSGSIPAKLTGGNSLYIGGGTLNNYNGAVNTLMVFRKYVPDWVVAELKDNPYQILKPRKKYFALSGSLSILLIISDLFHSKTSDNLSLSQQNTLAVDSNLKSASSDNIVLAQNNIITVNAITHSNLSDNLGLLASGSLTINSAFHSNTSTNLALIQSNNLSISNNLKSNLSDNLTLNAGDTLNINNIINSNTVSNIDLVQQNIIAIDSALHSKIGDNLILSQASTLSINAILHSKIDENVTLDFSVIIDIQNSVKSITSDNLTLLQANLLSIAGNLHSNTVDNIDLTQCSTLIISDILHSYLSDNLSLIDGAVSLSTNVGTVFMLGNNRNVFVVGSKNNILMR